MKKRVLSLILTLIMVLSLLPAASAAGSEMRVAAQCLYELGLFKGTGTNADGTPIFDLDKTPTRNQAVIMLVRLLGKEEEALAGDWDLPFTDVVKGSTSYYYIGYAYANGLTNGTTATTYSGGNPIRANQYITFVLRALGYTSGEDFKVSTAWEFSDEIGLTDGRYNAKTTTFKRGDVAFVSKSSLGVQLHEESRTLAEKLIAGGVFTAQQYEKAIEPPVILKETDVINPAVYFSIEGRMLGADEGYRTAAGSYVVTPYLRGERFTEFEVECEYGTGTVKKNADGTFTVKFPAKDSLDIALWYDFTEYETVDENGNKSTSIGRTKRSLTFSPPIANKGFVLSRNGKNILPGTGFGDNFSPFFVTEIYYNGVRLEDYTVTAAEGAPFTASIQADGTLLMMKNKRGRGKITVTYQGKTATFEVVMG